MRISRFLGLFSLTICMLFVAQETVLANNAKNTDKAVQTVIMDRMLKHKLITGNDIKVSVKDNVITLEGMVSTINSKKKAEKDAEEVGNGYQILNNLKVRNSQMTDKQLYDKVVQRLDNNVFYSVFDWVNLDVNEGKVTLSGWVYEPWHKNQFEHEIERVPGVVAIDNRIKIESGSQYDDQIRFRAASLIYDDPFYDVYSGIPGAPVHIVVNDGDVTLEGTVSTSYQKNWAKNAIYSNTGAFKVYNDLQIEGNNQIPVS